MLEKLPSMQGVKKHNNNNWTILNSYPQIGFQDQISLNAGQKYCRMLQGEHSAILSTFINKLPFVIKTFVLSIFEWLFYIGFTTKVLKQKREQMTVAMDIGKMANAICLSD